MSQSTMSSPKPASRKAATVSKNGGLRWDQAGLIEGRGGGSSFPTLARVNPPPQAGCQQTDETAESDPPLPARPLVEPKPGAHPFADQRREDGRQQAARV